MNTTEFTTLIWLGSLGAGFLGSLTGLGGGVVIVPLLTLAFGVDIRYAVGASLVSVIATSSGAASAYIKEVFSNMRIGMFFEIATTLGAIVGASLTGRVSTPLARLLRMDASYPTAEGSTAYHVHAIPAGFSLIGIYRQDT